MYVSQSISVSGHVRGRLGVRKTKRALTWYEPDDELSEDDISKDNKESESPEVCGISQQRYKRLNGPLEAQSTPGRSGWHCGGERLAWFLIMMVISISAVIIRSLECSR